MDDVAKTPLANQKTWAPTRKMTAAMAVGPAAATLWTILMEMWAPPLADPKISGLVGSLAAAIVAYFVRDLANVPIPENAQ